MKKLIPVVSVPIYLKDIISSIWFSFFVKREKLLTVFKEKISHNIGFKYVRTFQSGYLSLYYLLLQIKNDKQNNEVIIPVYTCPSVYFAVKNSGLSPVFVDVELNTVNSPLKYIMNQISKKTTAIIVLHLFGCYSVNIEELRDLLSKLGREDIVIIEDMCQALGNIRAARNSEKQYGDYGILSFGRAKIISTINGGAIISNNSEILNIKAFKSRNSIIQNALLICKTFVYSISISPRFFKYTNVILKNKYLTDPYRLNDYKDINHSNNDELSSYQLSLGISMLERLDDFNWKRKINAKFYLKYFSNNPKFLIQPTRNNFYLRFSVVFRNDKDGELVKEYLTKRGVITSTVDYPLLSTINNFHASISSCSFPNASYIASNILTFPTHPSARMTDYTDLFDELLQILEKNENL